GGEGDRRPAGPRGPRRWRAGRLVRQVGVVRGRRVGGSHAVHRDSGAPTRPAGGTAVVTGQAATLTATSLRPREADTVASPLPERESARSVQSPGAAKNRNCPAAEVTTSAVNSPVASSSRTYAPATGASPARTTPVM